MADGRGLVSMSYGGDSEISDSEDERASAGHTPPGLAVSGLGIPVSAARVPPSSPPSFERPQVHAAPSIAGGGGVSGLVAYGLEEGEEGREVEDEVFPAAAATYRQGPTGQDVEPGTAKEDAPTIEVTDEQRLGESEPSPGLGVVLPPEPAGCCARALQDKVASLLAKKGRLALDLNRNLQQRKDFRNPSIYEKLVQFCDIDEFGSSYPEHLFNPHEWGDESFYQSLARAQKTAYEKKEKTKLERTKVEFVTGTKRPAGVATVTLAAAAGDDSQKKPRRSKWDVSADSGGGGSHGSSPRSAGKPPGAVGAKALAQARHITAELKTLERK